MRSLWGSVDRKQTHQVPETSFSISMLYYDALALISARNIYGVAITWLDPSDEGCGGPSTQISSSQRCWQLCEAGGEEKSKFCLLSTTTLTKSQEKREAYRKEFHMEMLNLTAWKSIANPTSEGRHFPMSCSCFWQQHGIAYLLWWGYSHRLMSSRSLSLHLPSLPHLALQGLPAPPVQSPPLSLSLSLSSQTWLLCPGRKHNYNKVRQLQTSGSPEPTHSSIMLRGFLMNINSGHTEKPACTSRTST